MEDIYSVYGRYIMEAKKYDRLNILKKSFNLWMKLREAIVR